MMDPTRLPVSYRWTWGYGWEFVSDDDGQCGVIVYPAYESSRRCKRDCISEPVFHLTDEHGVTRDLHVCQWHDNRLHEIREAPQGSALEWTFQGERHKCRLDWD